MSKTILRGVLYAGGAYVLSAVVARPWMDRGDPPPKSAPCDSRATSLYLTRSSRRMQSPSMLRPRRCGRGWCRWGKGVPASIVPPDEGYPSDGPATIVTPAQLALPSAETTSLAAATARATSDAFIATYSRPLVPSEQCCSRS